MLCHFLLKMANEEDVDGLSMVWFSSSKYDLDHLNMIRWKRGGAVGVATDGVGGDLVGAFWADTGVGRDPVWKTFEHHFFPSGWTSQIWAVLQKLSGMEEAPELACWLYWIFSCRPELAAFQRNWSYDRKEQEGKEGTRQKQEYMRKTYLKHELNTCTGWFFWLFRPKND